MEIKDTCSDVNFFSLVERVYTLQQTNTLMLVILLHAHTHTTYSPIATVVDDSYHFSRTRKSVVVVAVVVVVVSLFSFRV